MAKRRSLSLGCGEACALTCGNIASDTAKQRSLVGKELVVCPSGARYLGHTLASKRHDHTMLNHWDMVVVGRRMDLGECI